MYDKYCSILPWNPYKTCKTAIIETLKSTIIIDPAGDWSNEAINHIALDRCINKNTNELWLFIGIWWVDFNHNQISAEDEVNLVKTLFPPQLMSWPSLMPIGISSHFPTFLVSWLDLFYIPSLNSHCFLIAIP